MVLPNESQRRVGKAKRFLFVLCFTMMGRTPFGSAMPVKNARGSGHHGLSASAQGKIRQAMDLTTRSSQGGNFTAAYEASRLWDAILSRPDCDSIPANARALCHTLRASIQTRIGLDEAAILSYDSALELQTHLSKEAFVDAALGRAYALQRLMRYEAGRDQFMDLCSSDEAEMRGVKGAFVCSMRLADTFFALSLLERHLSGKADGGEVAGLLGALIFSMGDDGANRSTTLLRRAVKATSSQLYRWVYHLVLHERGQLPSYLDEPLPSPFNGTEGFLNLAAVNQSPFDDPRLIMLDDKIFLHNLLSGASDHTAPCACQSFWPKGFIVPNESKQLQCWISDMYTQSNHERDESGAKKWILKHRAGYGSHGHYLATSSDVLAWSTGGDQFGSDEKCLLCQRLVDPPFLIDGRKFSLRVYVIYFQHTSEKCREKRSSVYISREGLVKLASRPFTPSLLLEDSSDDDMHMTNSGRGNFDATTQRDFQYLRDVLDEGGKKQNFKRLWDSLRCVVRAVVDRYDEGKTQTQTTMLHEMLMNNPADLGKLCLPKILGFDFLLDSGLNPWLVEVNRFPGLEPRGGCDTSVKRSVVRDAWLCASERVGLDPSLLGLLGLNHGGRTKAESLERI